MNRKFAISFVVTSIVFWCGNLSARFNHSEREQVLNCLADLAEVRKITDPNQCRCDCVYAVNDGAWIYDNCSVTRKIEEAK